MKNSPMSEPDAIQETGGANEAATERKRPPRWKILFHTAVGNVAVALDTLILGFHRVRGRLAASPGLLDV